MTNMLTQGENHGRFALNKTEKGSNAEIQVLLYPDDLLNTT